MGTASRATEREQEGGARRAPAPAAESRPTRQGEAADTPRSGRRVEGEGLANALGWFSIGLGLAQVAAPRSVARLIGVSDDDRTVTLMRTLGVRELASGVGLLSQPRAPGWAWSRVAGDVMDLALLGNAMTSDESERPRLTATTAAVVGVTALDVIAGQRLTRRSEVAAGERPRERGKRVVKSITVGRPPDEVYRFWHDFENLPRFMRHLESVQVMGDRRSHWKAKAPTGKSVEWDAEVTEDRPNELIAWRSVGNADVTHEGSVRFDPAPGGRGTQVTVDIRYNPPGGKAGAMVAKLFREEPEEQIADDLRAFKQVMEIGEVVVSDATVTPGPHPAQPVAERLAERVSV